MTLAPAKPRLSFAQILSMNVGFFGIQFSFDLETSGDDRVSMRWTQGGASTALTVDFQTLRHEVTLSGPVA